jgi:hypothetical protein
MKSESLKELASALAKAQAKMRPAAFDSTNPHFRSKYASLTAVWDSIREPLALNGLAVTQTFIQGEAGLTLRTTLLHQSGEWMSSDYPINPLKNDPQGFGSAITYARRYTLSALTGVVSDEDDDGNEAAKPSQAREIAPQRISQPVVMREPKREAKPIQKLVVETKPDKQTQESKDQPGAFIPSTGYLKGKPLSERGDIELEGYVLDVESKLIETGKTVEQMSAQGRQVFEMVQAELRARAAKPLAPPSEDPSGDPDQPSFEAFGGSHG